MFDPSVDKDKAFIWACENERYSVIQKLLKDPRVNPSNQNNSAFYSACSMPNMDVARLLLDDARVKLSPKDNWLIRVSAI